MTTHSDQITGIEPYWFGRPEQEIRAAVDARAETWAQIPGYAQYEWSDKGALRSLRSGLLRKTRPGTNGYLKVNVIHDRRGQVTVDVAPMILLACHPAFRGLDRIPAGLETRHNPSTGPLFNAYPEGLWPGTKLQNAADKDPQSPQYPCRNVLTCGNMVFHEGKRCAACAAAVGRMAAVLLEAGANLMSAAEMFGYTGPDWVHKLAVQHGGYQGTKAEALAQRPSLPQRVRLRILARGCDAL